MRARTIYLMCIVAFLVLIVAVAMRMPRTFVWRQTHSSGDTQPYGCAVFDSLMRQTLPQGYRVCNKPLSQLAKEKDTSNILLLADQLDMDSLDFDAMLSLAERGGTVMVACHQTYTGGDLPLWLYGEYGICFFPHNPLYSTAIKGYTEYTTTHWEEDSLYGRAAYWLPHMLTSSYIELDTASYIDATEVEEPIDEDSVLYYYTMASVLTNDMPSVDVFERLSEGDTPYDYAGQTEYVSDFDDTGHAIAVAYETGHGKVVFVSVPLLFTNYGVLTERMRPLLLRMLNELKDRPLVRTTYYQPQEDEQMILTEQSPTTFFLDHAPLRTALQVLAVLVLLLMVFKARRRQRAIPVYQPPTNHTLEFAQRIGTLYYQRRNNLDLVRKKYRVFAETLRRRLAIDITTDSYEAADIALLARRTGLPPEYLTSTLHTLRNTCFEGRIISDTGMKQLVSQMNEIIEKL